MKFFRFFHSNSYQDRLLTDMVHRQKTNYQLIIEY